MNDAQKEILADLITRAEMSMPSGSQKPWSVEMAERLLKSGVVVLPCKLRDTVKYNSKLYTVSRIEMYCVPYAVSGGYGNNEIHYFAENIFDGEDIDFYGGDVGSRVLNCERN